MSFGGSDRLVGRKRPDKTFVLLTSGGSRSMPRQILAACIFVQSCLAAVSTFKANNWPRSQALALTAVEKDAVRSIISTLHIRSWWLVCKNYTSDDLLISDNINFLWSCWWSPSSEDCKKVQPAISGWMAKETDDFVSAKSYAGIGAWETVEHKFRPLACDCDSFMRQCQRNTRLFCWKIGTKRNIQRECLRVRLVHDSVTSSCGLPGVNKLGMRAYMQTSLPAAPKHA